MASVASATTLADGTTLTDLPGTASKTYDIVTTGEQTRNDYTLAFTIDWQTAVDNLSGAGSKSDIQFGYSTGWWWKNGIKMYTAEVDGADILYVGMQVDGAESDYFALASSAADKTTGDIAFVYTCDYTDGNQTFTLSVLKGDTLDSVSKTQTWTVDSDKSYDKLIVATPNAVVEEAVIFNSVLSASDAKAVATALVPEPTTATLSLLALAGLAARRRRK